MQEAQLLQERISLSSTSEMRKELLHALPSIAHSCNNKDSKVPVFVMLPLDTVTHGGHLNKPRAMNASLMALKKAGVEGVMVDAWWGLVEKDGPSKYNWDGYAELVNLVQKHGLKIQVVMSFHQCGGNVGDSCRYIYHDILTMQFVFLNLNLYSGSGFRPIDNYVGLERNSVYLPPH